MNHKKIIALYPFNEKRHNVYSSTIKILSEKYKIIGNRPLRKKFTLLTRLSSNPHLKIFYHHFIRPFFSKKTFNFTSKNEPNCDLIFAFNQIPKTKKNYIVDIEILTALSGYDYKRLNKKKIQEEFEKENCKALILWNKFNYDCLIKNINCKNFMHKIHIIPPSINSDKITKKYNRNKVNLLFVSSLNNPFDFELKGGIIALEVYSELIKKYPNLTFTVRSPISSKIKKKYSKTKGIKFIEKSLSEEELKELFLDSDILLEPIPGVSLILECMNFYIPLILSDYWHLPDFVEEGKTAFIIPFSKITGEKEDKIDYLENFQKNYLNLYKTQINKKVIESFVTKTSKLILNKDLIRKMGQNAKNLLGPKGKYFLEKRNKKLLKIVENSF